MKENGERLSKAEEKLIFKGKVYRYISFNIDYIPEGSRVVPQLSIDESLIFNIEAIDFL